MGYSVVEFMAGLECHQQLDTKKLFCRCPAILREDSAHGTVKRFLRPSASELGEFDAAALEQFQRGHSYFYQYHNHIHYPDFSSANRPGRVDYIYQSASC